MLKEKMSETDNEKKLPGILRAAFPPLCLLVYIVISSILFDRGLFALDNNLLLSLFPLCLMLLAFRRFHAAVTATALIGFVLCYADRVIVSARLNHIQFTDFSLLAQAFRVANRYHLIWNGELTGKLLITLGLCALLWAAAILGKLQYRKLTVGVLGALGLAALSLILCCFPPEVPPRDADVNAGVRERGLLYSWYCQAAWSRLCVPEGYTEGVAEAILSRYADEAPDGEPVHVIAIMNESLADYSLLGPTAFDDPLVHLHGDYHKNFFAGKLAVSIFGGVTCNTEYEFLSGNSMAFLPFGSVPYLQYVTDRQGSVAWDMKALGQGAVAVHPYLPKEWNRDKVYSRLGFDRFISISDFEGDASAEAPVYLRGLVSDRTCLERLLRESEDAPFTFAVTMQNHGDYDYTGDDFEPLDYLPPDSQSRDAEAEYLRFKANQYLTLERRSDEAFWQFTRALERSEQKTIVLMFGDHQPGLAIPQTYVDCPEDVSQLYLVPYYLWANYDIEFDAPEITSPNYLSVILKRNAGLPLTAWDQFRLDAMEEYPVLTAISMLDLDMRPAEGIDQSEILRQYAWIEYSRIFTRRDG